MICGLRCGNGNFPQPQQLLVRQACYCFSWLVLLSCHQRCSCCLQVPLPLPLLLLLTVHGMPSSMERVLKRLITGSKLSTQFSYLHAAEVTVSTRFRKQPVVVTLPLACLVGENSVWR